ncbi:AraC family transcriptional regulator [Vagococcus sp. BWB3-3]|uniref:AraC family transcriptional regulator n=1 Tax=Vagococcus allomyrinae TaxID=2794353 RepID=A0A940P8D1_9ENTE|nr:helix-turn-helix domain-containing protein [Vagococcus allomyrinae]MBP1039827.1 AraC family transcriptional regulator [Vagococcus allomyrinae]
MAEFKPVIWHEGTSHYYEVKPALPLQRLIDCYWVSLPQMNEIESRIIPDLCADFIMTFTPEMKLKQLRYSGPNTRYFLSIDQSSEVTLGIRFYLSSLRNWLPNNLSQTKDQLLVEWDGFAPFSKHLMMAMEMGLTCCQLISSFNEFFLKELSTEQTSSSSLIKNIIKNSLEMVDYREIICKEVVSERTIQRIFREETGLSPYEAYDILRFQKALKSMLINPARSLSDVALSHGYCDQAHYNRRFKVISGLTPSEVRQSCRNYPRHELNDKIN